MFGQSGFRVAGIAAVAGSLILAACAPKPAPPPPPPPPPPKVVTIPPRPVAPNGAAETMALPPRDAFGVRQTVNYRLTPAQMTWNLRSAFNVAALNCLDPKYEPIVVAYRVFLKNHSKKLKGTQKTLDTEWRGRFGATFRGEQDAYNTQVYNYFALPPVLANFCDASLVMSQESLPVVPAELDAFAARWVPQLESVYDQFFLSYEAFQLSAAQWDAQYGPPVTAAQPAVVLPTVVTQPGIGPVTYGPTTNRR